MNSELLEQAASLERGSQEMGDPNEPEQLYNSISAINSSNPNYDNSATNEQPGEEDQEAR